MTHPRNGSFTLFFDTQPLSLPPPFNLYPPAPTAAVPCRATSHPTLIKEYRFLLSFFIHAVQNIRIRSIHCRRRRSLFV